MGNEQLGRFGHHPDPATDFEVEVQDLEAEAVNYRIGFQPMPREVLFGRIDRAMDFRVGGVESAVLAKSVLRELYNEFCPVPSGETR